MATTIVFSILLMVTYISCSEDTPSRLNLLRFFMGFGPEVSTVQKINFNPEAGLRYRAQYEGKYGPRGRLLIERFGQGLAMQGPAIVDVDQVLEPSKNKTKHYRTYDFNPPKSKTKKDARKTTQDTTINIQDEATDLQM